MKVVTSQNAGITGEQIRQSWPAAQEARSLEKEKGHNSEQNRHLRKTENR